VYNAARRKVRQAAKQLQLAQRQMNNASANPESQEEPPALAAQSPMAQNGRQQQHGTGTQSLRQNSFTSFNSLPGSQTLRHDSFTLPPQQFLRQESFTSFNNLPRQQSFRTDSFSLPRQQSGQLRQDSFTFSQNLRETSFSLPRHLNPNSLRQDSFTSFPGGDNGKGWHDAIVAALAAVGAPLPGATLSPKP
jgi:hypothetical protein